VRFDERWDREKTLLKFVTDGLLLREMALDPLLSRYSVVMLVRYSLYYRGRLLLRYSVVMLVRDYLYYRGRYSRATPSSCWYALLCTIVAALVREFLYYLLHPTKAAAQRGIGPSATAALRRRVGT
jgi:hypothetical protein